MFKGIIGSGVITDGAGGFTDLGVLGNAMGNTQTASLEVLLMFDDTGVDAVANGGFADYSGNDRQGDFGLGSPIYSYENVGPGNILSFAAPTSTTPNLNVEALVPEVDFSTVPLTILGHAKFNTAGAGATSPLMLRNRDTVSDFEQVLDFLYRADNFMRLRVDSIEGSLTNHSVIATPGGADTGWHQFAITHDGLNTTGSWKWYYDGTLLETLNGIAAGTYTIKDFGFLQGGGVGSGLGPSAYWSKALTGTEISDIYTASGL